jgi:hypothetical protein
LVQFGNATQLIEILGQVQETANTKMYMSSLLHVKGFQNMYQLCMFTLLVLVQSALPGLIKINNGGFAELIN